MHQPAGEGFPRPQRPRALKCDICCLTIKEAPYACAQHDYDLCRMCYNNQLKSIWCLDTPGKAPRGRITVQAAEREPVSRRWVGFDEQAADAGPPAPDAATAEATPKSKPRCDYSPVRGKRASNVAFKDPSKDLDVDGRPKDENHSRSWQQRSMRRGRVQSVSTIRTCTRR
jgi:hypothetical protein